MFCYPTCGLPTFGDTDHTVAPTDFEQEGGQFWLRAYSPLFMDVGPGDYRLVVWGYGEGGERVVLIGTGLFAVE